MSHAITIGAASAWFCALLSVQTPVREPIGALPSDAILVRVVDGEGRMLSGIQVALRPFKRASVESFGGAEYAFPGEREPEQDVPRLKSNWRRADMPTDENGLALLTNVGEGSWRVAAGAPPEWAFRISDETGPGARVTIVLSRLPQARVLSGIVLEPGGSPRPGAYVRFVWNDRGQKADVSCTAGPDGKFVLVAGDDGAVGVLHARVYKNSLRSTVLDPVAAGATGVELRLGEPASLTLDVRDPQGRVIEKASAVFSWELAGFAFRDESGSGSLQWELPTVPFYAYVGAANDYERVTLGPFDPTEVGSRLAVVLTPYSCIRVRVTHDASPVEGVQIAGTRSVPDYGLNLELMRSRVSPVTWGRSGADGRAECKVMSPRSATFELTAWDDRLGEGRLGPIEIDPKAINEELEIEITRAPGTIAGRVLLPPGREPTELWLVVRGSRRGYMPLGLGGSFTLPGLRPGPTTLVLVRGRDRGRSAMTASRPPETRWVQMSHGPSRAPDWLPVQSTFTIEVRPGETVTHDLDLMQPAASRFAGRMLVDGAPPPHRPFESNGYSDPDVRAVLDRGKTYEYVSRSELAPDGTFALSANEPGTYRLHLSVPTAGKGDWTVVDRIQLGHEHAWDQDIATGSLRVLPRMEGTSVVPPKGRLRWRGRGDLRIFVDAGELDPATREVFYPQVPVGSVQLIHDTADGRTIVLEAEISPRATTTARLP